MAGEEECSAKTDFRYLRRGDLQAEENKKWLTWTLGLQDSRTFVSQMDSKGMISGYLQEQKFSWSEKMHATFNTWENAAGVQNQQNVKQEQMKFGGSRKTRWKPRLHVTCK